MAEAMNKELLALRDAGCRLIQIEEPTFHFMANTFGKNHEEVLFLIDAFNREVRAWTTSSSGSTRAGATRTCSVSWRTPATPPRSRSILERCRGDVWTLEMKDRNQKDIELFAPLRNDLKKKICVGAVSHRTLQADRGRGGGGRDPQGARPHPVRAADRVERLRVRPTGLQPRDRVLQGQRDRARLQHRARRARAADHGRRRPRIRGCSYGGGNVVQGARPARL
jgi:hypothetical protein